MRTVDSNQQIRIVILNENDDKSGELFRLKKGWILRFEIAPKLSGKKIRLFTNICQNENDRFQRDNYQELKWNYFSHGKYDDSDRYILIPCLKAGSYHYYFTIDGSNKAENSNGQGYFQVEPSLIRLNDCGQEEIFEQESLTCQTVLSKSLGSFDKWLSRLEVSYQSGYSMIHFTPVQELYHISNSSYSVTNHHRLNPIFGCDFQQLKELLDQMRQKWKIFSITDLVYNHVANDCPLLKEHPESAYNLINSPHLKPAVLLDSILMQFTRDLQEEKLLSTRGIPSEIREHHLQLIRHYLLDEVIPKYRFWEYYICSIDELVDEFHDQLLSSDQCSKECLHPNENDLQLEHGKYQRMKTRVNLQLAEKIYYYQRNDFDSNDKQRLIDHACYLFRNRLNSLNHIVCQNLNQHLNQAIDNCLASCRYHFFSYEGPKYSRVSFPDQPFVGNYFHYPNDEFLHPDQINDLIENDINYQMNVMAHNGWVMNDDPLRCFADEGQHVYLRRDLLQWSDIIKIRFGDQRDDCPAVYDYMKEYTRLIATTFDGCRLDNCHSTPLWFAQEMMDYAREINPNFYINAELFTGNLHTDIHFINRIGINSLVRETHRAFDPHELSEICISCNETKSMNSLISSNKIFLESTKPYSWLYDQTHDNPSQIQRRSVEDLIPRSALISMIHCSTGSNRGYDELVPHYINVVNEKRFYSEWGSNQNQTNEQTGIISIKKRLNQLHTELSQQGFNQFSCKQLSTSVIMMMRHHPEKLQSIVLIAHTSFNRPINEKSNWEHIQTLSLPYSVEKVLFECSLKHFYDLEPIEDFHRSSDRINGLKENQFYFKENISIDQSQFIRLLQSNTINDNQNENLFQTFELTDEFSPGSIIFLQLSIHPSIRKTIHSIQSTIEQLSNSSSDFHRILQQLTLVDLNRVLYRSSLEEQSDGKGFDVYIVPDHGSMIYCGLQGQISMLDHIRLTNNLEHPLIKNLKQGNWLMDYIENRLKIHSTTKQLGEWYSKQFDQIRCLPRSMIPTYFDWILKETYQTLLDYSYTLMSSFIQQSSKYPRQLSHCSIQLISVIRNARLPLLSPNLRDPRPVEEIDEQTFERIQLSPSLAAGLPHFSTGIWRNWGRDTFISLRGLLLLTGRYDEARFLILSYGQCLRHGLIPNLLADGKKARYNARDAVWWWIYSILNYTTIVPDGHEILSDKISRLYPTNESPIQSIGVHDQMLYDVIHEVLLRHSQSLTYRERGAGHSLDSDMTDQGFNNQIGIDFKTGFPYGGNRWNCGTWMDKMGSSERAGNKGHPATPRDGSAIELVALLRSILNWLINMNQLGYYPYDSVETASSTGGKMKLIFTDWLKRIDDNFENEFWIDENNQSEYVNRRSIYKDTINSTLKWTDFQFRPNFLIAAVIAPEMFDFNHLWLALKQAESILLGKYGIKTLDPSDYNYVGDYNNDDDSHDFKRARGFNYHNGPEWLWLTGYYIRAKLNISKKQNDPLIEKQTRKHLREILSNQYDLLLSNDWKGLPELTNTNGQHCYHSCHVQAWSAATLIEAIYDLTRS